MERAEPTDAQLHFLTELLAQAFRAQDIPSLVQAIIQPPIDARRDGLGKPGDLTAIAERLTRAVEEVYTEAVPIDDYHAAMPPFYRAQTSASPERDFGRAIEELASIAGDAGAVLRAAVPGLLQAVCHMAERKCSLFALDVVRDFEQFGAPPVLVYLGNGTLLWQNSALQEMVESRQLNKTALLSAAAQFAGPFCGSIRTHRRMPRPSSIRVPRPGVFLRAEVRQSTDPSPDKVLLVHVTEAQRVSELSPRELEVAKHLCRMQGYRDVAAALGISLDSVRTHVRRAYRKLGINSRVGLKARLIRDGLIERS
jgi:DNA-binding CsgD family transcriptional regulator